MNKKNEIMKLKRARKLGLRLEEILKERIYRTGTKLLELQHERRKMEERIIKLESKTSRRVKNSTNS
ncbi:MAG: hypothetical protein ABSB40_00720 [Nitrososphaeria archaeon]|jgi:hypothetical protein